jgi:(4-(4-[2-(gamma-L-glutamylamino)ethyl]phenoxymethyl)furan-2-yl)methanamine synthase
MPKDVIYKTVGWDIGGAHLKVVLLEDGKLINAIQRPCELWRGLDRLEASIKSILKKFNVQQIAASHAVTMTGELVDLFENRREGVIAISNLISELLGKETQFYVAQMPYQNQFATDNQHRSFVGLESVSKHAERIASANWYASASFLAKYVPNALFVDMGSTTTDIIPIVAGRVANIGLSDALRMQEDTLVYSGVVRTPVMALAQKLNFNGVDVNVAAEYFATMADVYRLTGDLKPENDMAETADGKGKAPLDSARRLARMIGHDVEDKSLETWKKLAQTCKKMQINQIKMAVNKHLIPNTPIIGAGAGAFLVEALADELNCAFMSVADAFKMELNDTLSTCFPAYAVAYLAFVEAKGT